MSKILNNYLLNHSCKIFLAKSEPSLTCLKFQNYWVLSFLVLILLFPIISIGQCDQHPSTEFEANIIARSSGNDLNAPLISGEEVFISILYYSRDDTLGRVVHGLIPTFGPGWDLSYTDFNAFAPAYEYRLSTWLESKKECPPILNKDVADLCTYIDINGIEQLCNMNCETCPCTEGLLQNDTLPSGWFWMNDPTGYCIPAGSCPLQKTWGAWGVYSYYLYSPIMLDVVLKVGEFTDTDSCNLRNDLSIGFQEIFDDVTGCWESTATYVREKNISASWNIDCNEPSINTTFNKLKVMYYLDDNINGIKDDSEDIYPYIIPYQLTGDSIEGHSEYLSSSVLSGHDYQITGDINLPNNYVLSTPAIIDVFFTDEATERVVEFGIYKNATSVSSAPNNLEINVFPNPFESNITIEIPYGKYFLQITNVIGEIVYEELIHSDNHQINLTNIKEGFYLLNVYDLEMNPITSKKVIKY